MLIDYRCALREPAQILSQDVAHDLQAEER
jgi:hypothetical protein